MKKQVLVISLIISIMVISCLPTALADADFLVVNYISSTDSATTFKMTVESVSSSSYVSGVSSSFLVPTAKSGYVTYVYVVLQKLGSPNYNLSLALYGFDSVNKVPNNTLIGTSITKWNSTVITSNPGGASYGFFFNGTTQITAGTTYAYVLRVVDLVSADETSNFVFAVRKTPSDASIYGAFEHYSTWTATSYDTTFSIYANVAPQYVITAPGATPTPTPAAPTATATPDGMSTVINTVITPANILLFIALIIIIIPAILGAKFAGGWGFLAGLNVGVVLVVVFSVIPYALWIAVLIGMVDAVAVVRGMTGAGKADTVTKGE